MAVASEICATVGQALAAYHAINKRLKGSLSPLMLEAVHDMREQLERLIYPGFISETPLRWLRELPRYLRAIEVRLEKLSGNFGRDRKNMKEIQRFWEDYSERASMNQRRGVISGDLVEFRWLIEELRVSLFAQELGTSQPVSSERLQKRWEQLR